MPENKMENKKIGAALVVGGGIGGMQAALDLAESRIEGTAGHFNVKIRKRPRFVNEEKCTGCGICTENCPVHRIIYIAPEKDRIDISVKDMEIMHRVIKEYKDTEGPLVPILHKANDTYNYLPEPVLRYVADQPQ